MTPRPECQPLAVPQDDGTWRPGCMCGWESTPVDDRATAMIYARAFHDDKVAA